MTLQDVCDNINLAIAENIHNLQDEPVCVGIRILEELNDFYGKINKPEMIVNYPDLYTIFKKAGLYGTH